MVQKKDPFFHSTAASQATDVCSAFIYLISFYFPHTVYNNMSSHGLRLTFLVRRYEICLASMKTFSGTPGTLNLDEN